MNGRLTSASSYAVGAGIRPIHLLLPSDAQSRAPRRSASDAVRPADRDLVDAPELNPPRSYPEIDDTMSLAIARSYS